MLKQQLEQEMKEKDKKLWLQMELNRLKSYQAIEEKKIKDYELMVKTNEVLVNQIEGNKNAKKQRKELLQIEREKMNKKLEEDDELTNKKLKEKV